MSRNKIDFLFTIIVVLFLGWALWEARNWPAQSKLFPWSLGFIVLSLALTQLGVTWRGIAKGDRTDHPGGKNTLDNASTTPGGEANDPIAQKLPIPANARQRVITICCWVVGFFIGIWFFGFKLGSLFLTFIFLKFTANEKWMLSITIAAVTYLFFWLVFDITLKAPLDSGFVGDYFGLN